MGKVLEGLDLYKSFPSGSSTLEVLHGLDIAMLRGEIVSIVGASGVGKSTLLHVLAALEKPTRGKVFLDSVGYDGLPDAELSALRNEKLGFVFQFHHLLMEFTAEENVMMPALIRGESRHSAGAKARQLLDEVNLSSRSHHKPGQLSGGEQQRVAVARALVNSPLVVLADEPSGNLDKRTSDELHKLIFRLSREKQVSFLIATHNESLAESADRRLQLEDGKLLDQPTSVGV